MCFRLVTTLVLGLAFTAGPALAQQTVRPGPVSDTITTESGLRYVFLQRGAGARPEAGDLMVIHGVGRFVDGTEFWNTRTDASPYEYTPGVDRVIRGFEEGMKYVRAGDRVEITMTPDLAYGDRARPDIPANSTLIFDYEILSVHRLSILNLLRTGFAAGGVDSTLAVARQLSNLREYNVNESGIMSAANSAGRAAPANAEKVLVFGLSLLPQSYRLHQAIGRAQAQRDGAAEAIASYEAALRLNPNTTERERRDHDAATRALADLRAR